MEAEATIEQISHAVYPETANPRIVKVGNKDVSITPLTRRWQSLFANAALPLLRAELIGTEELGKIMAAGRADFFSISQTLIDSEIEADKGLDRACAVVLASKVSGSEKNTEQEIMNQIEYVRDHSTTAELWLLLEAQEAVERLIKLVGERLPVRFARSSLLAGRTDVTADTVKQHLNSYFRRLQEQTGDGS